MEANDQKSVAPLTDEESVAEYISRQVPYPALQATAPRATESPRLGDMVEAPPPRRWDDPAIVRRHPFEVYIKGQGAVGAFPKLLCAHGQICGATSVLQAISIADLNTEFDSGVNLLVWLEVQFDATGTITAAALKNETNPAGAGWSGYPVMYEVITGGYKWFHPIANIRAFTPPQSGFVCIATDGGDFYHIAQLERNHLRPVKMCNTSGDNYWMLQPGPGGPKE